MWTRQNFIENFLKLPIDNDLKALLEQKIIISPKKILFTTHEKKMNIHYSLSVPLIRTPKLRYTVSINNVWKPFKK